MFSDTRNVIVRCCRREFHEDCVKACVKGPYYKELWIALKCCMCGETCAPDGEFGYSVSLFS